MKHVVIVLVVLFAGGAYGQSSATGQRPATPESLIKLLIDTGLFEGSISKDLMTLGDAGAVLATKVLAGDKLTSKMITRTLGVLQWSFLDLNFVEDPKDRQPRTTLLLLNYFYASTNDPEVKARISFTANYINERYKAYLSPNHK